MAGAVTITEIDVGAVVEEPVEESGPASGGGAVQGSHEVILDVNVLGVLFQVRNHGGLIPTPDSGDQVGGPVVRVVSDFRGRAPGALAAKSCGVTPIEFYLENLSFCACAKGPINHHNTSAVTREEYFVRPPRHT